MKFLLFFVSFIFSVIFYVFYWLSQWKSIFWDQIFNQVEFQSLSGNLLIESFIFFIIWILFVYLFSDFQWKWSQKLLSHKSEVLYLFFYLFWVSYLYFFNNNFDFWTWAILASFLLSDIVFNHLSYLSFLHKYTIKLRYGWLIVSYISICLWIYYIYFIDQSFFVYYLLLFFLVFHFWVHKKFTNYISLLFSGIIWLFFLYNLYFFVIEL